MKKEVIPPHNNLFEQIRQTDESGHEFWSARDLSKVLEYAEFRNFKPVIDKAKESCKKSIITSVP
jgi:DNA-damage-inducible protein D